MRVRPPALALGALTLGLSSSTSWAATCGPGPWVEVEPTGRELTVGIDEILAPLRPQLAKRGLGVCGPNDYTRGDAAAHLRVELEDQVLTTRLEWPSGPADGLTQQTLLEHTGGRAQDLEIARFLFYAVRPVGKELEEKGELTPVDASSSAARKPESWSLGINGEYAAFLDGTEEIVGGVDIRWWWADRFALTIGFNAGQILNQDLNGTEISGFTVGGSVGLGVAFLERGRQPYEFLARIEIQPALRDLQSSPGDAATADGSFSLVGRAGLEAIYWTSPHVGLAVRGWVGTPFVETLITRTEDGASTGATRLLLAGGIGALWRP